MKTPKAPKGYRWVHANWILRKSDKRRSFITSRWIGTWYYGEKAVLPYTYIRRK